jgi:hypothetical protein
LTLFRVDFHFFPIFQLEIKKICSLKKLLEIYRATHRDKCDLWLWFRNMNQEINMFHIKSKRSHQLLTSGPGDTYPIGIFVLTVYKIVQCFNLERQHLMRPLLNYVQQVRYVLVGSNECRCKVVIIRASSNIFSSSVTALDSYPLVSCFIFKNMHTYSVNVPVSLPTPPPQ